MFGAIIAGVKIAGSLLLGPSTGKGGDAIKMIKAGQEAITPLITMYDERKFTDEEQSKAFMEGIKDQLAFVKATLEENSERSRLRRIVAIWLIRIWIATAGIYLFCSYKAMASQAWADRMVPASEDLFKFSSYGFLAVIGFFFGSHLLRGVADRLGGDK